MPSPFPTLQKFGNMKSLKLEALKYRLFKRFRGGRGATPDYPFLNYILPHQREDAQNVLQSSTLIFRMDINFFLRPEEGEECSKRNLKFGHSYLRPRVQHEEKEGVFVTDCRRTSKNGKKSVIEYTVLSPFAPSKIGISLLLDHFFLGTSSGHELVSMVEKKKILALEVEANILWRFSGMGISFVIQRNFDFGKIPLGEIEKITDIREWRKRTGNLIHTYCSPHWIPLCDDLIRLFLHLVFCCNSGYLSPEGREIIKKYSRSLRRPNEHALCAYGNPTSFYYE